MSDPRPLGLLLIGLSILAFLGSTHELLPAATFFPALALFTIGAFQLVRGQQRIGRQETPPPRTEPGRTRPDRLSRPHPSLAVRGAPVSGWPSAPPPPLPGVSGPERVARSSPTPEAGEIDLEDEVEDFVVSTDVSFPLEIQRREALADRLRELSQLLDQGVLSEAEYVLARTKLLH